SFRPGSRGQAASLPLSLSPRPGDRRPKIRRRQVLVLPAGCLSKARILVLDAGRPVGDRRGGAALLLAGDALDLACAAVAKGGGSLRAGRPFGARQSGPARRARRAGPRIQPDGGPDPDPARGAAQAAARYLA